MGERGVGNDCRLLMLKWRGSGGAASLLGSWHDVGGFEACDKFGGGNFECNDRAPALLLQ